MKEQWHKSKLDNKSNVLYDHTCLSFEYILMQSLAKSPTFILERGGRRGERGRGREGGEGEEGGGGREEGRREVGRRGGGEEGGGRKAFHERLALDKMK